MFQLGEWRVDLINDCWLRMDGGGAFGLVPKALWQRLVSPDENNLIPFAETCLLLRGHGHIVVVDTGMGYKVSPKQQAQWHLERPSGGVLEALTALGVIADEVDTVICTHLHLDHAGGNTHYDERGQLVASFPNATYYTQEREFRDASQPNERTRATYLAENFTPLYEQGRLQLLEGDSEILPNVEGIVTRGHTPGHMSVRVSGGGAHLGFVCDLASLAIHFEHLGWMTAYDVEPLHTLENKRAWQRWAQEREAILIFPHDAARPACRAVEIDGRFTLRTLDERWVNA